MGLDAQNVCRNFTIGSGSSFLTTKIANLSGDGKIYDYPSATPIGMPVDNLATDNSTSTMTPISNNRVISLFTSADMLTFQSKCGYVEQNGTITWGATTTLYTASLSMWSYWTTVLDFGNGKIYSACYGDYTHRGLVIDYGATGTTIGSYAITNHGFSSSENSFHCCAVSPFALIQIFKVGYERRAYLITVSGTTSTLGTYQLIETALISNSYDSRMVRIDANRVLYCYNKDISGNNPVMGIVIKTNGSSTVTLGNLLEIQDASLSSPDVHCDILSVNGNLATGAVVYGDTLKSRVLSIDDTVLNMGAVTVIDGSIASRGMDMYVASPTLFYVFGNGRVQVCKVTGTTVSRLGYITVPVNYGLVDTCLIKLSNSLFAHIKVLTGDTQMILFARPIGISQGSTGKVAIKGVIKGLSGLIPSSIYYTDGINITTDTTNPTSLRLGMAISATELFLDNYRITS